MPTTALLEGKVVAITGAASGLGEATARLMVAEGANVVLGDIQDDNGRALADELGGRARYVRCDVTQEPEVAGLVDAAMEAHGRLDGMFNNAGIVGVHGPIDEIPLDEYEFTMAVLVRSVFLGCKHAARVMKPQRSGVIISTSSVAGVQGGLGAHVYARQDRGHRSDQERRRRVGSMEHPGQRHRSGEDPDADERRRSRGWRVGQGRAAEAFKTRTPLRGRIGLPEDIANAAAWLMSDAAAFVSGQTLVVDGGLTSGSPENVAPGEHGRWAHRPAPSG